MNDKYYMKTVSNDRFIIQRMDSIFLLAIVYNSENFAEYYTAYMETIVIHAMIINFIFDFIRKYINENRCYQILSFYLDLPM